MTVDPLRDQLAANCDANPETSDYDAAVRALQDYDEAKARGEPRCQTCGGPVFGSAWGRFCPNGCSQEVGALLGGGPQPPAEDLRNALMIAETWATWNATEPAYYTAALADVARLIRHALTQLESPK